MPRRETTVTVGTTATLLSAGQSLLKSRFFYNAGAAEARIGGSGVTATTGRPLLPSQEMNDPSLKDPRYAIVASGTTDILVQENDV